MRKCCWFDLQETRHRLIMDIFTVSTDLCKTGYLFCYFLVSDKVTFEENIGINDRPGNQARVNDTITKNCGGRT